MPAFGKRRTGLRRWLNRAPDNRYEPPSYCKCPPPAGLSDRAGHCSAPARHAIIGTSGDATGAQRDTGGSMAADQGRQAPSAGTPEPSARQAEPSARQAEPSARQAEPSARQAEPSARQAEPSARQAEPLYGGQATRRLTIRDLAAAKARGEKWPMLTAYDALTAAVFDSAG